MNDQSTQIDYEEVMRKDILEILGASNLPQKEKEKLYLKMLKTVQNRVIARITDSLKDQEIEELKKLLDEANQEKITQFLKNKKIDWSKMMLQEAMIYKTELAGLAGKLEK